MDWENLQLGITGKTVMSPLQTEFLASTYFSMTLGWGCEVCGGKAGEENVPSPSDAVPEGVLISPSSVWMENGTIVGEKWPWLQVWHGHAAHRPSRHFACSGSYLRRNIEAVHQLGDSTPSHSITAGFLDSNLCFVVRLRLTDKIVLNAVQVPPPPPSSHVSITLKSVRMYVQSGHVVLMFRFTERTSQIIWVGLR